MSEEEERGSISLVIRKNANENNKETSRSLICDIMSIIKMAGGRRR